MKFIRRFFGNLNTEKIFSFVLPILIAVVTGFATNYTITQNVVVAVVLWFVTGILAAVFILLMLLCWHFQKVEKEKSENRAKNASEHFMDLGTRLNKYISSYMYNSSYDLNGLGKGQLNVECFIAFNEMDKFKHMWQNVCEDLTKMIKSLRFRGSNFGVNIIARMQSKDDTIYFMPAFDYTARVDSRSHLTSAFKNEKDVMVEDPYYLRFFRDSKIKADILTNEKNFKANFKKFNSNYKQLISIPIIYKTSTVAVLQLIGYDDSYILNPDIEKCELLKQVNNYFFVYEKLALLTLILGLKS